MSLLQTETTNLLGIGTGSVQDFAAGIRTRKKASPGMTREQALSQATANEGQDSRLRAQGDTMKYDPLKTDSARFMLNTNDQAFIKAAQDLQSKINASAGQDLNQDFGQIREGVKKLQSLAGGTSKGDFTKNLQDVSKYLEGQQYLSIANTTELMGLYGKAMGGISKKLDLSVDVDSYNFNPAEPPATQRDNLLAIRKRPKSRSGSSGSTFGALTIR